jgi:O-antigen ligase
LAWALFISLIEATSFYLAIFEWLREVLYFIAFLYLINNVTTRPQFRAITLALLIGLVISAGTVIVFFNMGIGTDSVALGGLYRQQENASETAHDTLYEQRSGEGSQTKRSSGLFVHPAHAAYYFEYILPIVLAYIVATRRRRDRLLFGTLFAVGLAALYMTFSRSGLVGLLVSCIAFIGVARWSELISRRAFARCCLVFAILAAVSTPVLINFLTTRPETITKRMELLDTALATYWQRPIIGAGLNNSSAVTEGAQSFARMAYGTQLRVTVVHNHYLVVLIEVGVVGFVLFFAFFWQTIATAFRHLRPADAEMKVLLAGIVSAMAGIAIHNFGDPFGGHVVQAMLWLYTGLMFAICRRVRAEAALPAAQRAVRLSS